MSMGQLQPTFSGLLLDAAAAAAASALFLLIPCSFQGTIAMGQPPQLLPLQPLPLPPLFQWASCFSSLLLQGTNAAADFPYFSTFLRVSPLLSNVEKFGEMENRGPHALACATRIKDAF